MKRKQQKHHIVAEKERKVNTINKDVIGTTQLNIVTNNVAGNQQKPLTKKEKMVQKHQKLMEKLEVTRQERIQYRKMNKKTQSNKGNKMILQSQHIISENKTEVFSLLKPTSTKSSNQNNDVTKNMTSIITFKDDLPAFVFVKKDNVSVGTGIQSKSKTIQKKKNKRIL